MQLEYAVSHFVAKQIILQNCMTLTVTNAYQTTTEFGRLLNYSNSYYPPIEQEGREICVLNGWDIYWKIVVILFSIYVSSYPETENGGQRFKTGGGGDQKGENGQR